jgi:formamidopyrimidine-DNA glycosylase
MPELPDVEGFRRAVATKLTGQRIVKVQVHDVGVLRNRTPKQVNEQLTGRRFREPDRLGKWLLLPTDGPCLLVHSGMTGRPYLANPDDEPDRYDRLVITTDVAQLRYADLRKLRGIWLAANDSEISEVIGAQGPDAFRISTVDFVEALRGRRGRRGRRGQLKAALLDQTFVAGLGNMLSDEICWRAHLHPAVSIPRLSDEELTRVAVQMQTVLRAAVRAGHIPRTRTWLTSRRATPDPAPCPRCATALRRTPVGGRTSLWCPHCQPERR